MKNPIKTQTIRVLKNSENGKNEEAVNEEPHKNPNNLGPEISENCKNKEAVNEEPHKNPNNSGSEKLSGRDKKGI